MIAIEQSCGETDAEVIRALFFSAYLQPGRKISAPPHMWFTFAYDAASYCDKEDIRRAITSMAYEDFLKTPYWRAIAQQVRYRARFRCQLCNSDGITHVHHRHYGTHGAEHENLHDLICLCAACHEKHHTK